MLELKKVVAYYGSVRGVHEVTIRVPEETCVAILGPNGSGKTTLLRTVSGLVEKIEGTITYEGVPLNKMGILRFGKKTPLKRPENIVRMGISHVPEGGQIFSKMSVLENLQMGAYIRKDRHNISRDIRKVLQYFPVLDVAKNKSAGNLSGGGQQMLAIGKALLAKPKLLLLDEPSTGLAPIVVKEVYEILKRIRDDEKFSLLLVEQNMKAAMSIADLVYFIKLGKITEEPFPPDTFGAENIEERYLGE